jgi:TonB family protein
LSEAEQTSEQTWHISKHDMFIMFSTIHPSNEGNKLRCVAFICGSLAEALVIGAAVLLGVLFPKELTVGNRRYVSTWILKLTPTEKLAAHPSRELARVSLPKLKSLEAPKVLAGSVVDLEIPKNRRTVPPPVPELALPVPTPSAAAPTPAPKVKEEIEVRTGVFGGAAEPVITKPPVEAVQTGGFGIPQGIPSQAQTENTGNTSILGAFELPKGPGNGNGSVGNHGVQGIVVSVGFSNGIASSANGRGHGVGRVVTAGFGSSAPGVGSSRGPNGPVALGGFEKAPQVVEAPARAAQAPSPPEVQPIEILSKPSPVYTEEARRLGIQGDVALSVVFLANGSVRICSVLKSLGHGLDQEAVQVASQIRFKPALRAGQPADFPATVRIEFRLAGQAG